MRALVLGSSAGLFLALVGAPAAAQSRDSLRLEVVASCPSEDQLATELAPLLGELELDPSGAIVASVKDAGERYFVSVGSARRVVEDPERRCAERAKVAAVYIALNLPQQRSPATPPPPASPPVAPPVGVTEPVSPPPAPPPRFSLSVRASARAEAAPGAGVSSRGLGAGLVLERGPWSLGLSAAVTTATRPYQPDSEPPRFELSRVPLALLVGWQTRAGIFGFGGELGPAVDLLRFEGETVPNPDRAWRVNVGLRGSGVVQIYANRRLQAELVPFVSWFPRTYLVRVEPSSLLAETPVWWLGLGVGLKYAVWDL